MERSTCIATTSYSFTANFIVRHHSKTRACHTQLPLPRQRQAPTLRASQQKNSDPQLSDDILARLRAAEEEAANLKKELEAARAQGSPELVQDVEAKLKKVSRIDGSGLVRETLFNLKRDKNWISESDYDFFSRGPSEAGVADPASDQEAGVVRRRLIIGSVLAVLAAAFALVPTDQLRLSKPSKPLFFYLVPVVRTQELLKSCEEIVSSAKWEELSSVLSRIKGEPNNVIDNLRDAAAVLEDRKVVLQAEQLIRDVVDYLDSIDYNKYFESLRQPGTRSGAQEAKYADFSFKSVKAAEARLQQFLALMPQESVQAARQQTSMSF